MRRISLLTAAFLCVFVGAAGAQSTYITVAAGVEMSRFREVEQRNIPTQAFSGGEAFEGALRVGAGIGQQWGVELEFARPATVTHTSTLGGPVPLIMQSSTNVAPIVARSLETEQDKMNLSALAWVRRTVSASTDLVFLGGIGFHRTVTNVTFAGGPIGFASKLTEYGAGPVVGMEARIGLTTHVQLVPGLRLHGIEAAGNPGWLLRADAGIGWVF